jgi:D-amino-acid dehydrogenase
MVGQRVIVVGGGVIGATCAYYLSKSGQEVTVVERGEFGKECSHGNCGLITPSHVLPLPQPGAIAKAMKSLLNRDSPLRIKPRFDLRLWGWLWKSARRCNVADMMESARARHALLESSVALYRELLDTEPLDCEWETRGILYPYQTQAELDRFAETDKMLRESFGLAATRYDGDALVQLEPALKPGLAGGWYYQQDAHLRPDKLMSSWRQLLESMNVTIQENTEVRAFARVGNRARGVITADGELPADVFVVATGAMTPMLRKYLGCKIPIQPGKGYSMTMPRPERCPTIPMLFPEHKVAVTPMQSGYRLGSTMEFAGYDATLNQRRLNLLRAGARPYLHEPYTEPVEEQWYGWRPMTYDGKPIIDRSPATENVYIAAGHNMLGVSMAPATGKLITELVTGAEPHIGLEPYSVKRF